MSQPARGIDGPAWCYPGDRATLKSTGGKFICTTFEPNSLEYGDAEEGIAYFKRDPRELPGAPQYERDRHAGFRPEDVTLTTQTELF
jgi:hypothetical protein